MGEDGEGERTFEGKKSKALISLERKSGLATKS